MEESVEEAYVTSKGQLVVPAKIRRRHGIKPGTKVCFIERGGEILLQPVTRDYIRSVCGMLQSDSSATRELVKTRARDKETEDARSEKKRSR